MWVKEGRIVYASNRAELGKQYKATKSLRRAWQGKIAYEIDQLEDSENAAERALNMPLIEIYVPVRQHFGGDVIAIVEFYEDASFLAKDILQARIEAWLIVAVLGFSTILTFFGSASRASAVIKRQRSALNDQINELSELLDQNRKLRQRVESNSRRTAALNERHLRRIGVDLHDGPAQLISLALIHLDASLAPRQAEWSPECDNAKIREPLTEALKEIRDLSMGLALPDVEKLTLKEAIEQAIETHEHRTNSRVVVKFVQLPELVSQEAKTTAYRIAQEALANSARHASGAGIEIEVSVRKDQLLFIEVKDDGPGFNIGSTNDCGRIGLSGMRERVECIGGTLEVISKPGYGTRINATFPFGSTPDRDL